MIEILLQAERSLTVGQLDAAERLYWQSIENDPKNSIAVVGLARVALERGDERTAYQFARKALDIDPENAAAQRLAARLDEVMAHRGEQPPTESAPWIPGAGGANAAPTTGAPSAGAAAGAAPSAGAASSTTPAVTPARPSAATTTASDSAAAPLAAPRPPARPVAATRPAKKRGLIGRILGR